MINKVKVQFLQDSIKNMFSSPLIVISRARLRALSLLVALFGALAECSIRAGTMWFLDPSSQVKRVPMYPAFSFLSFPSVSKPFFNNSLAVMSALSLLYCLGSVIWLNLQPTEP